MIQLNKVRIFERKLMNYYNNHPPTRSLKRMGILLCLLLQLISSCGHGPARLIDAVKEIPISGGHDTMYMERSSHWDRNRHIARTDSNRQVISFKPAPGEIAFVTLRNMGGVPLHRDTIRSARREAAEHFLRTGTLDTNMHLTIDFADPRRASTDVIVFIRNRDSVYREFLFYGK